MLKTWYCVTSQIDKATGKMSGRLSSVIKADSQPVNRERESDKKCYYMDWFDSLEAAEKWLKEIENS